MVYKAKPRRPTEIIDFDIKTKPSNNELPLQLPLQLYSPFSPF